MANTVVRRQFSVTADKDAAVTPPKRPRPTKVSLKEVLEKHRVAVPEQAPSGAPSTPKRARPMEPGTPRSVRRSPTVPYVSEDRERDQVTIACSNAHRQDHGARR